MQAMGNDAAVPKSASEREGVRQQLRKLERENQQLRLKLARAEGLIELQKKASALLESLSRTDEPGGSNLCRLIYKIEIDKILFLFSLNR